MHSRDAIDLLWYNVMHYSSLFQYFFLIYNGPYSSWKFSVFVFFKKLFLEMLNTI